MVQIYTCSKFIFLFLVIDHPHGMSRVISTQKGSHLLFLSNFISVILYGLYAHDHVQTKKNPGGGGG